MGLFRRKSEAKERIAVDSALIDAAQKYVENHMPPKPVEVEKKKPDGAGAKMPVGDGIKYSIREPAYTDDRIQDMKRFLDDARLDTAMFDSPALQNAYHEWEKKTAVRKTFSSEVLRMIKEMNMKPAEFYRAAELDKRVFHAMKSNYLYAPSRATAIRCCFALKLRYEEAVDLLRLASLNLSPGNSRDLVVRFCLENEIYDIPSVNAILMALGEKPLA